MNSMLIAAQVAQVTRKSFLPMDTPMPRMVRQVWSGRKRKRFRITRDALKEIISIFTSLVFTSAVIYLCGKGVWW